MSLRVLLLCLSLGCSPVSANNSSVVGESQVVSPGTDDENSKTLDCDDPKGYSVVEVRDSENYVNILRGDTVLSSAPGFFTVKGSFLHAGTTDFI
jgi:hypothetical protein